MHRLIRSAPAALAVVVVLTAASAGPAQADGWGKVNCTLSPSAPECTVTVVDPGNGGGRGEGEAGGPIVCRIGSQVVDCHSDTFGWLGTGGCYYGKDAGGFQPSQEYIKTCLDAATGDLTPAGTVWLLNPPSSLAAAARRAVSQLRFPEPGISASPLLTAPQVVQVPVWWWVEPDSWRTQTATAALPGITFTARATPQKITWDAGDGTRTECTGPGTPWTSNYAPTAPSPTCGHTYRTTSKRAPGGRFTLRAVTTWAITWEGAGLTGTEPAVTTTATAGVEVIEVRAVITNER